MHAKLNPCNWPLQVTLYSVRRGEGVTVLGEGVTVLGEGVTVLGEGGWGTDLFND